MRSLFTTFLVAVSNAAVHEYMAESHFICGLCQQAVDHSKNFRLNELSSLYELYPALESKISNWPGDIKDLDLSNSEGACRTLGLCDANNMTEYFLREKFVDLNEHIEHVNNSPNATWKAGVNSKFEGATYN